MSAEVGRQVTESNPFDEMEDHRRIPLLVDGLAGERDLERLAERVDELRGVLAGHFADEVAPGGLFEQLLEHQPANRGRVAALVREHADILRALVAVSSAAEHLRHTRERLVRSVREHHDREHRLALDTYLTDIGGPG